jgi:hypothetical protein
MKEIAQIWKNKTECIKVSIDEYKGTTFINCRVYYKNAQGQWLPTAKEIAINNDSINKVIDALMEARKVLRNSDDLQKLVAEPKTDKDLFSDLE